MDAKDWIFAQNWVEQYKDNRPITLELNRAFIWISTPQGAHVWSNRYNRQRKETEL